MLLAGLEKRPDIAETLNGSFERMLARYREVQTVMPELAPKPKKKDYRGCKGRKGARKGVKTGARRPRNRDPNRATDRLIGPFSAILARGARIGRMFALCRQGVYSDAMPVASYVSAVATMKARRPFRSRAVRRSP